MGIEGFHLSWMTSFKYQTPFFLVVYALLLFLWGLQFGILSHLLFRIKPGFLKAFVPASFWVVMEWLRLFLFSGYTWNPLGLYFEFSPHAMQLSTIFGIYGLSFWIVLTNIFMFWIMRDYSLKFLVAGLACILLPYIFGMTNTSVHSKKLETSNRLKIALVQTSYLPEEKVPMDGCREKFILPFEQWRRALRLLKDKVANPVDLIVFPEAAFYASANIAFYPLDGFIASWQELFGVEGLKVLPPLKAPYASRDREGWKVSNGFWAQAVANLFKASVIVGLDDFDFEKEQFYNAAFYFTPGNTAAERYIKRKLLPLGEYIPFNWVKTLASCFGIHGSFTAGDKENIFSGPLPLSVSICYEETFAEMMRKARKKGSALFVNLTNDGYFPKSNLPRQHFDHGRVRAIENGVPMIRSCNIGISAAVDALGNVIKEVENQGIPLEDFETVLTLDLPVYGYATLYTFWGDGFIVGFSFLVLLTQWIFSGSVFRNKELVFPLL